MSSIKLVGSTSGEITISAPAVAGTSTLTLPTGTGNILTDGAVANNGIYLGGTASANLLDDYEEGTWTSTFSFGGTTTATSTGYYTKIGNKVIVHIINPGTITKTGTGTFRMTLPFVPDGSGSKFHTGTARYRLLTNMGTSTVVEPIALPGQAELYLQAKDEVGFTVADLNDTHFSSTFNIYSIDIIYETTA